MKHRINPIFHWFGRFFMWLVGWKIVDPPPYIDKYILIAGTHTALVDTLYALGISWTLNLFPTVFIKHTMFRWPFGWLFRKVGGVPIDRTAPQGVVSQIAAEFDKRDQWVLLIAPDGKRIRDRNHPWKTGFYHIAMAAGVPIVAGSADFKNKRVSFSEPLMPTGNKEEEIAKLRAFIDKGHGYHYKKMISAD